MSYEIILPSKQKQIRRVDHQGPRYPAGNQTGNEKYMTGKQLRSK